ncbi:SLOG family protein [Chakrabartyella piscis]|uniref:SLOG family protein n=1 Tax=Chakrabartyella piscis TaxID=2918914 RepID=UPI0029584C36|nr:SLOG family protein [Chakrabartyella piscis]
MKKEKTICFTGHRKLPKGIVLEQLQNDLYECIKEVIQKGFDCFVFGGAIGWDLLCAELILQLKKEYKNIRLIGVIPFWGQEKEWSEEEQVQYYRILSNCDEVIVLHEQWEKNSYKKRNQCMTDYSSMVIAYWNGNRRSGTGQTVRMGEQKNCSIMNLYKKQIDTNS